MAHHKTCFTRFGDASTLYTDGLDHITFLEARHLQGGMSEEEIESQGGPIGPEGDFALAENRVAVWPAALKDHAAKTKTKTNLTRLEAVASFRGGMNMFTDDWSADFGRDHVFKMAMHYGIAFRTVQECGWDAIGIENSFLFKPSTQIVNVAKMWAITGFPRTVCTRLPPLMDLNSIYRALSDVSQKYCELHGVLGDRTPRLAIITDALNWGIWHEPTLSLAAMQILKAGVSAIEDAFTIHYADGGPGEPGARKQKDEIMPLAEMVTGVFG